MAPLVTQSRMIMPGMSADRESAAILFVFGTTRHPSRWCRSRHVASRRMERGAPQRHQPPETVGLPKYPPDQTNRVWRVARDGVSALARGGRRSFSPAREGRTGEWAGGQAGRRAGGRAGGTMVGHGQTSERAGAGPWREMYMRASFAPSPPCDDGRLPRCTCHHTTCLGALWYQTQTRSPRWVLGSEKTPHNPSSITLESLLPCLCAPWRGLRRVIFVSTRAVNPQTRNATAVDQVHCRVSYVDSQQIGSVVRPRQERQRRY